MSERVQLLGYRYSVYTRIVRMVLHEKEIAPEILEIDPFSANLTNEDERVHPFGRVPVFRHGDFELYETVAITRYIDAAFAGASLMPDDPRSIARVVQVLSILDGYGYWPMVRQVFAHAVFRPFEGEPGSAAEITEGLECSHRVLQALEAIAAEARVLDGERRTLADCHLAAMIDYFTLSEGGARALRDYPCLERWWQITGSRNFVTATDPGIRPATATAPE